MRTTATFDTIEKSVREMEDWYSLHGKEHPVLVAELKRPSDTAPTENDRAAGTASSRVIGWVSLSRWSDRKAYDGTVELSLYVDESHRGRGIGTMLLERALEEGRCLGLHTVISRIAGENEVSIHLHTRFGFEKIGTMREVGLKFGRLLDVHLYQLIFDR